MPDLDALALHKLEYDFRYWQLLRRGHEVIPELTNGVFLDVLDRPRDPNPARVVFSVEPFLDACEPDTEARAPPRLGVLGLRVSASAATTSERGDKGTVDADDARARPIGCGCRIRTRSSAATPNRPRDLMGPNPQVHGFDEWVEQGITFTPGPPQPVTNGFTATLTRVAAVTLDLARMGLDPQQELTATVTGDGRTDLHLRGGWRGPVKVSTAIVVRGGDAGRRHAHAVARLPR